jgi:hypothetical protein
LEAVSFCTPPRPSDMTPAAVAKAGKRTVVPRVIPSQAQSNRQALAHLRPESKVKDCHEERCADRRSPAELQAEAPALERIHRGYAPRHPLNVLPRSTDPAPRPWLPPIPSAIFVIDGMTITRSAFSRSSCRMSSGTSRISCITQNMSGPCRRTRQSAMPSPGAEPVCSNVHILPTDRLT